MCQGSASASSVWSLWVKTMVAMEKKSYLPLVCSYNGRAHCWDLGLQALFCAHTSLQSLGICSTHTCGASLRQRLWLPQAMALLQRESTKQHGLVGKGVGTGHIFARLVGFWADQLRWFDLSTLVPGQLLVLAQDLHRFWLVILLFFFFFFFHLFILFPNVD